MNGIDMGYGRCSMCAKICRGRNLLVRQLMLLRMMVRLYVSEQHHKDGMLREELKKDMLRDAISC